MKLSCRSNIFVAFIFWFFTIVYFPSCLEVCFTLLQLTDKGTQVRVHAIDKSVSDILLISRFLSKCQFSGKSNTIPPLEI